MSEIVLIHQYFKPRLIDMFKLHFQGWHLQIDKCVSVSKFGTINWHPIPVTRSLFWQCHAVCFDSVTTSPSHSASHSFPPASHSSPPASHSSPPASHSFPPAAGDEDHCYGTEHAHQRSQDGYGIVYLWLSPAVGGPAMAVWHAVVLAGFKVEVGVAVVAPGLTYTCMQGTVIQKCGGCAL